MRNKGLKIEKCRAIQDKEEEEGKEKEGRKEEEKREKGDIDQK